MNIDKLKQKLEDMVFCQINDAVTRKNVENFLIECVHKEYVDYRVICDESNNTPETIDQRKQGVSPLPSTSRGPAVLWAATSQARHGAVQ